MNVTWEERELGNNFCNAPTLGTPFCIRCGWTKPYMMDGVLKGLNLATTTLLENENDLKDIIVKLS